MKKYRSLADQERLSAEIRQAEKAVANGHWLLSWGTDHELPPPKCVCGKDHDDD